MSPELLSGEPQGQTQVLAPNPPKGHGDLRVGRTRSDRPTCGGKGLCLEKQKGFILVCARWVCNCLCVYVCVCTR